MSFLEEFDSITFGELKHISGDDIPLCLTRNTALRLCQESVQNCEATGYEVLHMWVNKLLRAFGITTFSTEEWCELLRIFQRSFKQLISTIDKGEACESFATALEELRLWLLDSLELLKCIQPEMTQLSLMCVCVLLEFFIDEILDLSGLFRISKLPNVFKEHMQNTILIHTMVLKILNENMDNFAISNTDEFSKLTELIVSLCEVGAQTVPLDFKTILETWKCVAKLVTHCTKYSHYETSTDIIERRWVQRPMEFLLKEVKRNLIVISKKETLSQSEEQLDKYLRVTNFYLKLLLRLTADYKHASFPAVNEFLDTSKTIHEMTQYLGNSKISEMLEKYVHLPLNDVFLMIYQNDQLQKAILDAAEGNAEMYSRLICDFLRAHTSDHDAKIVDESALVFIKIFEQLFKTTALFIEDFHFDEIVRLYAALVVLSKTSILKHYLIKNVLTAEIWKAHASTEVLLIALCCSAKYTTPTQLYNEFCFWRAANEKFALFSSNSRQFQVQRLLRNALSLCKANENISHSKLCEQQLSVNNEKFLLAVGLQDNITNIKVLQSICVRMSDNLFDLIKKLETGVNVESYYKTITYVKLYMTANVTPKSELLEKLLRLLMRIYKEANTKKLSLLEDTILDFAALHISSISVGCLQQLLCVVNEYLSRQQPILSGSLLAFLNSCCQHTSPVVVKAAQNTQTKIVESDILKTCPFMLPSTYWEKFRDLKINNGIYRDLCVDDVGEQHMCAKASKPLSAQSVKRQRLDDGDEHNVKFILSDILEKSQQIANATMNLDQQDISIVTEIINNLSKAICNK